MVILPQDIVDLIEKVNKISHEIGVPLYDTMRIHKNRKQAALQISLKMHHQIDRLIGLIKTLLDTTKLSAGAILLDIKL